MAVFLRRQEIFSFLLLDTGGTKDYLSINQTGANIMTISALQDSQAQERADDLREATEAKLAAYEALLERLAAEWAVEIEAKMAELNIEYSHFQKEQAGKRERSARLETARDLYLAARSAFQEPDPAQAYEDYLSAFRSEGW